MTPKEVATAFFDKLVQYSDDEINHIVDTGKRILAEREAEAERKLADEIKQKEAELADLKAKVKKPPAQTATPAATPAVQQKPKRSAWGYR